MQLGCATRPLQFLEFSHACAVIAGAGFSDVALFYSHSQAGPCIPVTAASTPRQIAALKQACAAAGLQPSLLLAGVDLAEKGLAAAIGDYARLIEHARQLGCSTLLDLGCGQVDLLADYLALMQAIEPVASEARITITIKPHGGITASALDLLALKQRLASDVFRLSFDPGNLLYYSRGEIKAEAHLEALAPHCAHFIVKDFVPGPSGPSVEINPGDGWVDFAGLLHGLQQHDFRGPMYLECVAGKTLADIERHIQQSRLRMHTWLQQGVNNEY
ncbi:sugar phosphate isomerase/epimerase [Iodobacter sp. HSC-16F04]|uniref:Sugar phosphate isomerase/epimerase n=1 Tax=Iodobacter violaceini TaxID=3044271 RepID=A0ABX0KZG7_9NEIS|nr:TIM barrel protein [Iodobacter violacea]NHQ86491.1 sugar phosphate isomerase/epimerase [Iodobacter violacea]